MDTIEQLKQQIEQMIGISSSDAETFWALSKKCSTLAVAPSLAAGAKWGPEIVAAGTLTLPFVGTVSGATAALLMIGGVWTSSYGACMSLLPGLMQIRDKLRDDSFTLGLVRQDARRLVRLNRSTSTV